MVSTFRLLLIKSKLQVGHDIHNSRNRILNLTLCSLTNIFRYVRDRMQTGNVFGSKDLFSGLAVIADTYSNHNGPHNVSMRFKLETCEHLIVLRWHDGYTQGKNNST